MSTVLIQPILAVAGDNKPVNNATKPATQTQFLPLSDYIAVLGDDETKALAAPSEFKKISSK